MSKHTPGPWFKEYDSDGDGYQVYVPGKMICHVPHHSFRAHDYEEADARLIAAAPTMYAELKFISENLDHEGDCPEENLNTCLRCAADRALSKAEGREG